VLNLIARLATTINQMQYVETTRRLGQRINTSGPDASRFLWKLLPDVALQAIV
jgi:hypothetical protein